MDIGQVIDDAVGSILNELPVEQETEVEKDTDATQSEEVLATEADSTEESETEETEESEGEEKDADGYVAVPVLTGNLETQFTLHDAEGELEVPDLVVEYKAGGKVRRDRLDKVVKLAQWGFAKEEKAEHIKQMEQEYKNAAALIAEREQQIIRLLQEDEYYEAVKDAYLEENTPEKRASRAEQQLNEVKVTQQMAEIERSGNQFWEGELLPAIQFIAEKIPGVSEDEIAERCVIGLQPMMDVAPNGQPYIPASRYEMVRNYIKEELLLWAQTKAFQRNGEKKGGNTAAQKELERARIEAQKAKRLVGQKTKPLGKPGKTETTRKQKPPATLDDAVDSALSHILSNI